MSTVMVLQPRLTPRLLYLLTRKDCWQHHLGRDNTNHQILPNATKFPDGIKGVADKVHDMGLKFGIYSSAGTLTCGGYEASLGYEKVDAATFADWGVDYLVSL